MIWYLYFLMFYVGCLCYWALSYENMIFLQADGRLGIRDASAASWISRYVISFITISTEFEKEFYFVLIIFGGVIGPQILSFLISVIFGCGRTPKYIETTTDFSFLSIIKFFCAFSAIEAAWVFFTYIYFSEEYNIANAIEILGFSFYYLFISFFVSVLYYKNVIYLNRIKFFTSTAAMRDLFSYMTKYH